MAAECSVDFAGGSEIIRQKALALTGKRGQKLERYVLESEGAVIPWHQLRIPAAPLHRAISRRGRAVPGKRCLGVLAFTVCGEAGHVVALDVVPAQVAQIGIGHQMQIGKRARELGIEVQTSTPSIVLSEEKAGKLPHLCVLPLRLDADRQFTQVMRAPEVAFQTYGANVAKIHVRAHGKPIEADMPLVFRLKPKGEIGVGDGKRFLFRADLHVDASTAGFNVRKARALLGSVARGGCAGNLPGAEQYGFHVPVSAGINQIQAGSGIVIVLQGEAGNFKASPPQRGEAQISGDFTTGEQRFGAKGRIIHDPHVVKIKSRAGKQTELDLANSYLSPQRRA